MTCITSCRKVSTLVNDNLLHIQLRAVLEQLFEDNAALLAHEPGAAGGASSSAGAGSEAPAVDANVAAAIKKLHQQLHPDKMPGVTEFYKNVVQSIKDAFKVTGMPDVRAFDLGRLAGVATVCDCLITLSNCTVTTSWRGIAIMSQRSAHEQCCSRLRHESAEH